ncbi:UDP-N-acetylmuramoyl-L-alanine--D-glutamate ligase [bacterium]|nr:UDP-N-acetylmuramoyl-L-alanine--D-glutamate ligase [bacterium]|tara:strand:+ start:128 stop:1417 length:1290 start_codon:yes stop_codon:yes gene_type:complete
MNLNKYNKIGIIGFAREGRSILNYLEKINFQGEVYIMDRDISLEYPDTFLNVSMLLGKTYLDSVFDLELVFKSAGVPANTPALLEASKKGVEFSSNVNLFFAINKKPVIAVSGTKGKSSTVTFIDNVLKKSGFKSQLVGNIGNPILDYINADVDYFVFEISSYMLESFQGEIDYGVFTSFFPDHMDTHGSFENYKKAKFNFFKVCNKLYVNDFNQDVKNYLDSNKIDYISFADANVKFFDGKLLVDNNIYDIGLDLGTEILNNFIGAISCLLNLNIPIKFILEGLKNFKKLPCRQEVFVSKDGIRFVNDSASITPESTIAAVKNFKDDLEVLILGGQNRGYDYSQLNNLIIDLNIKHVLVLPDLNTIDFPFEFKSFENLQDLITYIVDLDLKSGTVLFSPGGASYNFYKNFYERGIFFLSSIKKHGLIS